MKKYILKPGKHQFVPGSPAVHTNDNLTDEEAEWYLQRYPHITGLFAPQPPEGGAFEKQAENRKRKRNKNLINQKTPPSGGWGANL
jgi:glyoxylate utilization-related uncharacterized protein